MRALALIAFLTACNSETSLGNLPEPPPDPPLAVLEVSPLLLHFDEPASGDAQDIWIENTGTDDLLIEDIGVFLPEQLFSVSDAPLRLLEPGASTAISVSWIPTAGEDASGLISIETDVALQGSAEVVVTATAAELPDCDPDGTPFGGGLGSSEEPWRVCSTAHFATIPEQPSDAFALYADLDFGDAALLPMTAFTGVFDGRGHQLSNWTHSDPSTSVNLFGQLDGAVIRDLTLRDMHVVGGRHSAILAKNLVNGGSVDGVHIHASSVIGSDGLVSGVLAAVGVGTSVSDLSFDGTIQDSSNTGFLGGVINSCQGTCSHLVSRGSIDGGLSWKVGGIVNFVTNGGVVSGCASHMDVNGGSRIGGIAAVLGEGTIEDCYATGTISGLHWVGGIVGESYSGTAPQVRRSYARGAIVADTTHSGEGASGLVSWDPVPVTVVASAWDTQTTGVATSNGGEPRTTAELQDPNDPLFATWTGPWVLQAGAYPALSFE